MDYFLVLVVVAVSIWGQYWYDKAHRVQDAMMFMLEQDEETEDVEAQ